MILSDILNYDPKGATTCFRHHPELLVEFKKTFPNNLLTGDESIGELIYLNKKNILEKPKCICGSKVKYVKFNIGYKASCGESKCREIIAAKSREQTCQKKFGGKAPACNEAIIQKMKLTIKEKYGVNSIQKIEWVNEKKIKTNLERYGVSWPSQKKEIREKTTKTLMDRYGEEHALRVPHIMEKVKNTQMERYGYDNNFKNPKVREEINKIIESKFGTKNIGQFNQQTFFKKIETATRNFIVLKKQENSGYYIIKNIITENEFKLHKSRIHRRLNENIPLDSRLYLFKKQFEISDFVSSIYDGKIINDDRDVLEGKHIDIFLPEINIGIEFNGIYWHNELHKEDDYHLSKLLKAKEKNIELIQIFEDEWDSHPDIVKSIISNKFNKNINKIYARKCEIKEVINKNASSFLNENHIQGHCNASVKLGLYYNNELVSLMSFAKERIALGARKKTEGQYEMIRFCNKLYHNVIGGASKLFKYFLKNYNPNSIISYADKRWFNGSLYEKLGFKYMGDSVIDYWYVIQDKRKHRFNYRKSQLVKEGFDPSKTEHEIMFERKIYRIYDCGNKKYKYFNESNPE